MAESPPGLPGPGWAAEDGLLHQQDNDFLLRTRPGDVIINNHYPQRLNQPVPYKGRGTVLAEPEERLEEMLAVLKGTGHRITPQRLAILNILAKSEDHPEVEWIYRQIRKDYPTTSLATVYKTVTLLKELGQVLELGFADRGSRYDGNKPYPHPHLICTRCGSIMDPEYPAMKELAEHMAKQTGFEITHHRLDFFGLCPKCRAR